MRRVKLAIGAVLLLGIPVTLADAQAPAPTVSVTVSGTSVVLDPAPIGAGPTRFTFDGQGEFDLATLRAGVSLDQLREALSDPESIEALKYVFLEGSTGAGKAITVDLRPNTTYVAAVTGSKQALTTFTTGAPTGAVAPQPDARIKMVDYGFRGKKTLPRNGTIRVENAGTTFHFAIAFPLREGVARRKINRGFRGTNEKALERVIAGPPVDVQGGLISQGTTSYNEVSFDRPGRYAMVCFFSEHNRLGMFRVYRVR